MALTAEEEEAIMECDIEAAASGAAAGKRPAGAPPLGEPAPARARPPVDPHEDTLGGAATHTLPTPNTNHPPEEDASAESLFGQSTHPSEGVTPHGPRTESATARKPAGKVKRMGWLTVSCPANTQGQLTFADVEDAISILLMDLTDDSREGGAIEGIEPLRHIQTHPPMAAPPSRRPPAARGLSDVAQLRKQKGDERDTQHSS
ncbi:hypothetical protein AB1Y20_021475 [Prymnesium parvum]|uniref:Uncharacterized protein n=1 Tax=Prymnesium parvum TaxID=97485 RepID=A0AB34JJW8_PRYPA